MSGGIVTAPPTANELFREAQRLIRMGQPVFPCHSENRNRARAKAPISSFVPHGLHDATLDVAEVKRWLKAKPNAALAIPTGIVWDVLDVDVKNGQDGRVYLPRLIRHGLLDGCQHLARTPSGGWHFYFKATPGLRNKARHKLGLDVRAKGGYVIAPPSWIDDGESSVGTYDRWDDPTGSTGEPLMWDLIMATIAPVNTQTNEPIALPTLERQASVAGIKAWLFDREQGERNNSLHWAVRRCLDAGIDPNELEEVALYIGLAEEEVRATIDGAIKRTGFNVADLMTEADALFNE